MTLIMHGPDTRSIEAVVAGIVLVVALAVLVLTLLVPRVGDGREPSPIPSNGEPSPHLSPPSSAPDPQSVPSMPTWT